MAPARPWTQPRTAQLLRRPSERFRRGDRASPSSTRYSGHNYELRYWLAACGVDPERDIEIIILPPPLMTEALANGALDGYCVGEPWNTAAVDAGARSYRHRQGFDLAIESRKGARRRGALGGG